VHEVTKPQISPPLRVWNSPSPTQSNWAHVYESDRCRAQHVAKHWPGALTLHVLAEALALFSRNPAHRYHGDKKNPVSWLCQAIPQLLQYLRMGSKLPHFAKADSNAQVANVSKPAARRIMRAIPKTEHWKSLQEVCLPGPGWRLQHRPAHSPLTAGSQTLVAAEALYSNPTAEHEYVAHRMSEPVSSCCGIVSKHQHMRLARKLLAHRDYFANKNTTQD
jgi:hypothetical protein